MSRFFLFLLTLGGLWAGYNWFVGDVFDRLPPKRLAKSEPNQAAFVFQSDPIVIDAYTLQPTFLYHIEALVLAKKNYSTGRESDLSPVDLALGWGPMSNPLPLKQLRITQSGRFYHYRYKNPPPIPPSDIKNNSANTHIIPASDEVNDQLKRVRKGDVVDMRGYLVNVSAKDGYYWNSSVTRKDSGNGACELFYVTSIKITKF